MIRRLCVLLLRRLVVAVALLCLGCVAQSNPSDLNQRIERQVRASFNVPSSVQITVGTRSSDSEFPSYDKVAVTFSQGERKQTQEFLLSKDGKTLVRITKLDISKDPYAAVMSKIDLAGRPVRGNKDAKVTIVNYDDFQCPYCARMHQALMQDVLKKYGDRVKIVYKDFPLPELHPWATRAAIDANCLAQQSPDAYWSFADYAHSNQAQITGQGRPVPEQLQTTDRAAIEAAQKYNIDLALLSSCLKAQSDKAVTQSVMEARELGVDGTPTLFVNGEKVMASPQELPAILDRALRDAGQPAAQAAAKP
jgi:protein-disulfide isomerase